MSQTLAITAINLKSVPERWGPSLVIVIGLAGVVAVFTALLAMAEGFSSALQASGRADAAIVMRGGSSAELNSGFGRESADLIKGGQGIKLGADGKPEAAAELVIITELLKKGETQAGSNMTLRGVEPASFTLRPKLKIVEGRMFQTGLRELIVGRGVQRQYAGVEIGKTLRMRGSEWTVVGVFEAGDATDSELWTDAEIAQSTFNRSGYSSVLAALDGTDAIDKFKASLAADPRLNVEVQSQQAYFSSQTRQFRTMIRILAGVVTIIMGLGAIFAALNTMYAAVSARSREIATLRALGFGAMPVTVSVLVEALFLALIGGIIGALLAYVLFNNVSLSTLGANFTQVVFSFSVTPALVLRGLVIALLIGFIGALVPAFQSAYSYLKTWAIVAVPLTAALVALVGIVAGASISSSLMAAAVAAVVTAVQSAIWYFLARSLLNWALRRQSGTPFAAKLGITLLTLLIGLGLFGPVLMFALFRVVWSSTQRSLSRDPLLELTKVL
ncbi:MAG: ABC transporter permease [Rhodanobacteraceae bacterium]|nr:ABC transporter permease [Rhodanobacteraceae bacterium]